MNITEQKQTHREQIRGYQRGEGSSERQVRGGQVRGTGYYVQNK